MQEKFKVISESFKTQKEFCAYLSAVKDRRLPVAVTGASHIHRVLLCLGLISSGQKPFIVVPGESEAERTAEDLESLGADCVYFPARDYTFRSNVSRSHEYEHKRLGALSRLLAGNYDVCITTAESASGFTVLPDILASRQFSVSVGDTVSIESLAEKLAAGGYVRSDQVDGAGQFSVRGSILDFFTPDRDKPCRVDFFGDEIDTVSVFDPDTQRRIDCIKTVSVSPVSEFNPRSREEFTEQLKKLSAKKKIDPAQKKTVDDDIERYENGLPVAFDKYLGLIFEKSADVFDYMPQNGLICIFDTNAVYSAMEGCLKLCAEETKSLLEEGMLPPGFKAPYNDTYIFNSKLKSRGAVFCDSFPKSFYEVEPKELIGLNFRQSSGYSGSVASLCEDIKASDEKLTVVLAGTERAASNLCEDLCRNGIEAKFCSEPMRVGEKGVFVTVGQLTSGFELPGAGLSVFVYGTGTVRPAKRRYKKGGTIGSLEELQKGDHVVHATHGIGIFDGVEQIKSHGIVRDYIRIAYAGRDVLYVPVTSLELVSRYVGAGGEDESNVKINRLGSKEWNNTRARVRKAVKDMAKQLTALYATRMHTKGYAFSPDGDLQSDFESRFEFEETDDQLRCASEIKHDMERGVPMDRLLCGDVGFGKTEVALRAAFKCIADGKQCAILVPTTILCWQHFNTALERFGGMAVNIEMLSRFRTPKQQEKIKKELRAGNIDLIIGTHSLIAKDVVFKDLGLIIVDEEQRFGVAQKERLKELFPGVDALTLSATPIPRTLNMALSGLRDMSSIEEAPLNRRPVQTYVLEQDTAVVNEAIDRELRRGGQVYYLHNRTESIDACAVRIKQSHPDANVAVAHGKMDEAELSKVWQRLLEREIDILVCTTIIETGVDVPNVNTLIIENADMMGLAQLHQIRGRVGRSHRTAYAYLFFTAGKALSEVSQKRLDAIRRFTEFGSGFRIAMRDLEIRGAGNILGGEQHGHMEAVGYDMYLKMLNDAIAEEKGEATREHNECLVDIRISANIPEEYISSLTHRLAAYRRIADIRSEDDMFDVTDELLDRYGDLPVTVDRLIKISYYKNVSSRFGFSEIGEQNGSLLLYCGGLTEPVVKLITSSLKKRVMFSAGNKPYVTVKPQNGQKILDLWAEVLGMMSESD